MKGEIGLFAALLAVAMAGPLPVAAAQVQIRLGDANRITYSELHEALSERNPDYDSVRTILQATRPIDLWRTVRDALAGRDSWNHGLIALTRIAELGRTPAADSAVRLGEAIAEGKVPAPPGDDPGDLLSAIHAIRLTAGDRIDYGAILARIPSGDYDLGDAWVLGRAGGVVTDSLVAGFRRAAGPELRVRYLTLLSFNSDSALVPLLGRVYAAPDSFGIPPRYGARASDGLLWIGTRGAVKELLRARDRARVRGVYADPRLARGGFDFLANDSSAVVSRTGRSLQEWLRAP